MANPNPSHRFTKGDPRIWRGGRPKSFPALQELAQQIAHESALKDGQPLIIEGHRVTVAEAILRTWATSKNPQLVKAFIEIAFGKVPDNLTVDQVLKVIVEYADAIDPTEAAR
jgi:hypothetical protein